MGVAHFPRISVTQSSPQDDSIVLAKDGQNRKSTASTASVEDMDEKVPVESEA